MGNVKKTKLADSIYAHLFTNMSYPVDAEIATTMLLNHYHLKGENFTDTPKRVAKMWDHFYTRYGEKPELKGFTSKVKKTVVMRNHIAWGFCPHHLLPVRYTFTIGYAPNGKVLGLSKLARLAEYHLQSLPLQEDLTVNIAEDLFKSFKCKGTYCLIKGYHLCAVMRGVKSEDIEFETSHYTGALA